MNRPEQRKIDPDKLARLKAEAKNPYKGMRQFLYLGLGASGFIGAVVFLARLAAGKNIESALPNFALQIAVVALMVTLFRLENREKAGK